MEWADARTAAALFAVDPAGTGGVVVRAHPGPAAGSLARGTASEICP